jgi:hypothetical protein
MRVWVSSGPPENWRVAIQEGGVWGVDPKPTLKKRWDTLSRGDLVAFYVSSPISRVVGLGCVKTKSEEDAPLWPAEKQIGKAKWIYRFRFDILHCLDENSWGTKGIPIGDLRIARAAGLNLVREKSAAVAFFQRADVEWGTDFTKLLAPEAARPPKELSPHEEVKNMIYDVGVWQGWISEKECRLDSERLDVAWFRKKVEGAVPKVVFEVHLKGNPYSALGKLKDAFDKWNSSPVIITVEECREDINRLLGGTFHEIADEIKILMVEDVKNLYDAEKKLNEIKKEKSLTDIL